MPLEIVDPATSELAHLASVDVRFSGAHIGGGIYFSANHNPFRSTAYEAIPQRGLTGEAEPHQSTEYDFTLPADESLWDAYLEDTDGDGEVDFMRAGFDIGLQVGDRLASTGEFYDGPAAPLLIANDPNDLFGNVTVTGYPSAANSLDGTAGTLHQTTGVLSTGGYTIETVGADEGGSFFIDGAEVVGGMSGGGTFLDFDANADGTTETYLIGATARAGTTLDPVTGEVTGTFTRATSFSPHYADLAATIEGLTGDAARSADDFGRMVLLSAQTEGSALTTVQGQFFHEDIYGGVNDDSLFGGGGNDHIFGGDGADLIDGGTGNDQMTGGAGADLFAGSGLGDGATDVVTDFRVSERDVIDLSTYFETLDDVVAATEEMADGSIMIALPAASGGGTVQVLDTSIADLTAISLNVVCFTKGTLILTPQGEQLIETLCAGAQVALYDGGFAILQAVNTRRLGLQELLDRPNLWPVVIRAGALGAGVPRTDLHVSPQHRILTNSLIAHRMGGSEVLVAAKKLIGLAGVSQPRPQSGCCYIHLVCSRHEVIRANGCWSESFYPGDQAMAALDYMTLREYRAIFGHRTAPRRPIVAGKRANRLLERHVRNKKPLQVLHGSS